MAAQVSRIAYFYANDDIKVNEGKIQAVINEEHAQGRTLCFPPQFFEWRDMQYYMRTGVLLIFG